MAKNKKSSIAGRGPSSPSFSVRNHGKSHLELKTTYPLEKQWSQQRFSLHIYLFFPPRLNLNREFYSVKQVLRDVFSATRLSSPRLDLEELCNRDNLASPLTRLYFLTDTQRNTDRNITNHIIYELKMFVNSCRRNMIAFQKKTVRSLQSNRISNQELTTFLDTCEQVVQIFQSLEERYLQFSSDLQKAYSWADEALSLTLSDVFLQLLIADQKKLFLPKLYERISFLVETQQKRRVEKGYKSGRSSKTHLHQALLKKWTQSVLYLELHKKKYSQNLFHILASIAAGLAMLLSVSIAFFAQRFFNLYSTPWIVVIILSYIFKDRIKEIVRESLLRLFPKLFSDRKSKLCDPISKRNIGTSQITISYPTEHKIPKEVLDLRNKDVDFLIKQLPKNDVLLINQQLFLKSAKILGSFSRVQSLTEVLRIRVRSWLNDMDEPEMTQFSIHKKEILQNKLIRGYDVRMILYLPEQKHCSYYQLLCTKKGLYSIEKLN